MTDEEYRHESERCRKSATYARDEKQKIAWLKLAEIWLGMIRGRPTASTTTERGRKTA
jgi:hypothetical protein